ncbi:DDHD domain-containing protein [Neofusicoccum parvum]|uniref:DDHD domain-containing protein n=1 Tax=Neofusicoccum parvum TaxID=310453 RepID=A0ACB5RWL8_9PEZI|nr:DDHD domain-containing protein [Neofusicoccum parvum]
MPRMPSNVELETHNFTREEIAEERAYALNDNGQIDYFMKYGGGPLEIQYLTMLGAHSSYWISRDFVKMIVSEVGRPFGKEGTIFPMRAIKKKER